MWRTTARGLTLTGLLLAASPLLADWSSIRGDANGDGDLEAVSGTNAGISILRNRTIEP